jgi:hypothetical protein
VLLANEQHTFEVVEQVVQVDSMQNDVDNNYTVASVFSIGIEGLKSSFHLVERTCIMQV